MRFLMSAAVTLFALAAYAAGAYAFELDDPDYTFDELVFEQRDGAVLAPRAVKQPGEQPDNPSGALPGWVQADGDDYAKFRAAEVFPIEAGSIEIDLVVIDAAALDELGDRIESLVILYDRDGQPFFMVGINARAVTVGSFPLDPAVMEGVFGGVRFRYGRIIGGKPEDGAEFKVCVTWGPEPSDNRVYIDGERVGPEQVEGTPVSEPAETLSSYLNGFTTAEYVDVGPAYGFVVGRVGLPEEGNPQRTELPRSVGIKSVRITNYPLYK